MNTFEKLIADAGQGDADAQCDLGLAYYDGEGVERDYTKAAKWLSKAVENGNECALYNLAFQYQYGEGVSQDFELAEELYLRYLELETSAFVQGQLGALYRNDNNPRRDDFAALRYHEEAAVWLICTSSLPE